MGCDLSAASPLSEMLALVRLSFLRFLSFVKIAADLSVTYLRQSHGLYLDAEATVIKRGRQLCTVEVKIVNDQGELSAIGRVLYGCRAI